MSAAAPVLLAIDTATEQCSVALLAHDQLFARGVATARGHAEIILPMVQDILAQAALTLNDLDAIAFGRGPGGFTGVRLAVSVTQGLAFALDKKVLPVSNLAAVAYQAYTLLNVAESVLVCMDARMGEVYTAVFTRTAIGLHLVGNEQVCAPDIVPVTAVKLGLGTGFTAYPLLQERFAGIPCAAALPHARDILQLAQQDFLAGKALPAEQALPVYVRDQVTHVKPVTMAVDAKP